ncbi:MAG TPA: AAA family ATPase [Pirellulales bacterium]|nr:AAA family ATPase [Pirellulales bacterium]
MATVELKRDILLKARDRSVLSPDERAAVDARLKEVGPSIHTVNVRLEEFPQGYWRAMLDDTRLTANQRAVVARHVFGMQSGLVNADDIYRSEVGDPVEFGSTFATLGNKSPNCECFLNGRWYPVVAHCEFLQDEHKVARDAMLVINLSICEMVITRQYKVYRDLFLDAFGQPVTRTVLDVLQQFGLRQMQLSCAEFNLRLVKAERQSRETGKVLLAKGPVLVNSDQAWWSGIESRTLGAPDVCWRAIVEPELEVQEERRQYFSVHRYGHQNTSRLPYVRLFCLEIKRYVYVDIDDLAPYEFDTESIERLCLPAEMLSVLTRVFEAPIERVFGDLIRGKHGGVVVLASGSPGVGKTLTAEIYAEYTERPLYVLEMGELGTNAAQVEEQLRNVFARVTRWNAVLQFDECEVFLAKRNDDLERSAIVGIFLRLLDYYHGMLFLTSNRPEVIDDAVLSRVMLRLQYPDLTAATRVHVWRSMLAAAQIEFDESMLTTISEWDLNGRQIRNLVRLGRILFPDCRVALADMEQVRRYGARPMTSGA